MIDFDYNATTPVKESVRRAMEPYLTGRYGNPSSIHQVGQAAKAGVEQAREYIAASVNADPEALVLTGSGSEANTLAIRGYLDRPFQDATLVSTPVEHSSVKGTLEWLETRGVTVKRVSMLENGQIDVRELESLLDDGVDLVSVMTVNNETGVVFPVEKIGEMCRDRDVTFHTDAVQAYGKRNVDFNDLPVDMLSVSAHKVGGPKGVGALFAPKSLDLEPLIFGGHQERDRRGGTENVPGVVGFGRAAKELDPDAFDRLGSRRDQFESYLKENLSGCEIVGREVERVANTAGLILRDIEGEDVVMRMDMAGYGIATGSACKSGSSQPSHVLESIPLPEGFDAKSFVRFSFSPHHTEDVMIEAARELISIVEDLRTSDPTKTTSSMGVKRS